MMTRPQFWVELVIMMLIPLPMSTPDSFFGFKVVYINCVNWADASGDYNLGSHEYSTPYLSNDFFLAAMFLRFFFIIQTLVAWSPPNNKLVGKRVCHEQGIDPTFGF